jgi:hypothetical protein
VPKHQDLDVLGRVGSGKQRQPAQHVGKHQVRQAKTHGGRSCWTACEPRRRGRLTTKALIRGSDTVPPTHRRALSRSISRLGACWVTQAPVG